MQDFEQKLHDDLLTYLSEKKWVDERIQESPDIEEKWMTIGQSYLNDGIREFTNYPTASLGWMFYIGMAIASYWDTEWEIYSKVEDLYVYLRDKRGYDHLDDYVREVILGLDADKAKELENQAGDIASRVYNLLLHQGFEPGTADAFRGYVACLHQLYIFGAAMQLNRLGYHMNAIG